MTRAILALGSNLGDRLQHLQGALDGIAAAPGLRVLGVSPVYETDPVGGPDQPDYLNAVVVVGLVTPSLDARALLALAHRLEDAASRVRAERWGPRTLDVDVIWVEGETVDDPDLVVPHPRAGERSFVLAPLADLDPALATELAAVDDWTNGVHRTALSLSVAQ